MQRATQIQDCRTFRQMIRNTASDPAHCDSVLADQKFVCRYPDIPAIIDAIHTYLSDCGVRPRECITLELANSVPAALSILALLDGGHSVMLMPIQGRGSRAPGARTFAAPSFARFIASVRLDHDGASCDLAIPSTYLDLQPNPDFSAAAANEPNHRIYLRTSGSLGTPKLIVHRHERFLQNILHARDRLGLNSLHRVALPIPIFHAYGLGPAFLGCIAGGASVDLQERANLLRYLEREEDFEPNIAFMTPSFCEFLVRGRRSKRPYDFMVTAGDRIGKSTFFRSEELHGPLINAYGSTEMGFIFSGDTSMPSDLRFRTVGRALPGVEFRIVDTPGVNGVDGAGALQVKHSHGFEGYVDLDGAKVTVGAAFDDDWYCTGDLAKLGPDGTLEVLGRSDLSVNRNGMLLTFADIEAGLRELDAVEEAGVAAGAENIRGRQLVAFCVLGQGANQCEQLLRAEYSKRVPAFAVPEHIRIVDELPKLANGKIDRAQLAMMADNVPPEDKRVSTTTANNRQ